jgi:peptidyl-tRNA hydrolase
VIVREDIPRGLQVAQTVHAAGESVERRVPTGTRSVAIGVPDESTLRGLHATLHQAGVTCVLIEESDGTAMAIGCAPVSDRAAIRRLTSHLPLVGKEART